MSDVTFTSMHDFRHAKNVAMLYVVGPKGKARALKLKRSLLASDKCNFTDTGYLSSPRVPQDRSELEPVHCTTRIAFSSAGPSREAAQWSPRWHRSIAVAICLIYAGASCKSFQSTTCTIHMCEKKVQAFKIWDFWLTLCIVYLNVAQRGTRWMYVPLYGTYWHSVTPPPVWALAVCSRP